MPVMDGLQATRIIRSYEDTGNWDDAVNAGIEQAPDLLQRSSTQHIPIIAVSIQALYDPQISALLILNFFLLAIVLYMCSILIIMINLNCISWSV